MTTVGAPVRTLLDVFDLAAERGSSPVMSFVEDPHGPPAESMSYADLDARADRFATHLHRCGVAPGDRVAIVALPRTDYLAALVGALRLGAVPAPVNHQFKARELGAVLDVVAPSMVVVDDETCPMVRQAVEGRDGLVGAGISGCSSADLRLDEDPGHPSFPRPSLVADDPALILHSSGTTGLPKAVVRTHGSVVEFLDFFADYFDEDERLLNFLPLYHQAGLVLSVLAACRLGRETVQVSRFSASAFWSLVDRFGATHVNMVSPMASFVLSLPPTQQDRDHTLRWVVIAGRNDHWAEFQDRYGVRGMTFYGSTETLQITSTGNPKDGPVPRKILEAVGSDNYTGYPLGDLTQFRVVGEDGSLISAPGRSGALEVRGRFCFSEYLHQPDQTAAAFTPDGWFRTGDVAYTTDAGALVLVGRRSGMIRRSGENIAPREIELVLEDHPGISEALVVGVPDEARGQELLAQVVPVTDSAVPVAEVFEFLEQNLSTFKVPRYLLFRDQFERTSTLKIKLGQGTGEAERSSWHDRLAP